MCPFCISTAAIIAGSITSSGGLAAVAIRKLGPKTDPNSNPRRDQDGKAQSSLAR
jgi:hypothetical protein